MFVTAADSNVVVGADGESEGMMTEEEQSSFCVDYWNSWSPAIAPKGMSPANALRALVLGNNPFSSYYLKSKMEEQRLVTVDTLSDNPHITEHVENAFIATTRNGGYVDYYEGTCIKTDFTSFPILDASGYDTQCNITTAQTALNLYAQIDRKMDRNDSTLCYKPSSPCEPPRYMPKWCLEYPVPTFIEPCIKKMHDKHFLGKSG